MTTIDPLTAPAIAFPVEPAEEAPIVRLVEPDGSLTAAADDYELDVELARTLYQEMARARRLDTEALSLQRQGELSLWLESRGQEAAQIGSSVALRPTDTIFPSYREHGIGLSRGLPPEAILAQWRGVSHSGWADDHPAHMHITSLVLGTQTLHAVGYAAGIALDDTDEIVAVYFGDGAASEGEVNEALNWAAASSLPVLFVVQNNQWAISTPTSLQMGSPLHRRAAGFGIPSYHVDGNDALAVHLVTSLAAERVRAGNGPALVEARTYRLGGHSSSDDPKRYRNESDVAEWKERDPLVRLERLLRADGTPDDWFRGVDESLEELALEIRRSCRALTASDFDTLFDNVYSEPHPVMERERQEFRRLTGTEVAR